MARRGEVTILEGLPGFASVRAAILRFASTPGSVLTSSNSALIAQARDLVEHDENLLAAYEFGQIEIRPLGLVMTLTAFLIDTSIPRRNSVLQSCSFSIPNNNR